MVGWVGELVDALKGGDSAYFTESRDDRGRRRRPVGGAARRARPLDDACKGGKIDRYQVVTPSTWNMSPRDADGERGPLEEALVGTPVADPARPLEALRVVHSFDP